MSPDKPRDLANLLSIFAVRLLRWLRAADGAPTLSGAEASAMAVIVHSGGVTPSGLAAHEGVRRPTITRIVNGLVERRLVERRDHPSDKRAHLLVASPEGSALWAAGQLRIVAPLADRIAALDSGERDRLERALPVLMKLAAIPDDTAEGEG